MSRFFYNVSRYFGQKCSFERFLNLGYNILVFPFFKGLDLQEQVIIERKKKFGEESDFVSVHVPKSKRAEYRQPINEFVEYIFSLSSNPLHVSPPPLDEKIKAIIHHKNFERQEGNKS